MSTIDTESRNAACDAVTAMVDAGAGPGTFTVLDGETPLVVWTLESQAFGAASNGQAALAGTPKTASAVATGTADNYQIADSDGNVRISGAVVQGDPNSPTPDTLTMVNTSITSGQQVSLGAFVHEQPASTE